MYYNPNILCPYMKYCLCRQNNQLGSVSLSDVKISPQKFSISYPVVKKDIKNPNADKINNAIIDEVDKIIRSQVLMSEPVDFTEVLGTYDVTLNEKGILSIFFSMYTYINMAAHGYTAYSSVTIDTVTGQVIDFYKDLFNASIYYTKYLNDIAKKYIKDNNISLINEYNGVTPDQKFYLTPKSIVLYYQLYDYTPYVYGPLKIEIPYDEINNLMKPNGVLRRLVTTK